MDAAIVRGKPFQTIDCRRRPVATIPWSACHRTPTLAVDVPMFPQSFVKLSPEPTDEHPRMGPRRGM